MPRVRCWCKCDEKDLYCLISIFNYFFHFQRWWIPSTFRIIQVMVVLGVQRLRLRNWMLHLRVWSKMSCSYLLVCWQVSICFLYSSRPFAICLISLISYFLGYIPGAEALSAIHKLAEKLKHSKPNLIYLLDRTSSSTPSPTQFFC